MKFMDDLTLENLMSDAFFKTTSSFFETRPQTSKNEEFYKDLKLADWRWKSCKNFEFYVLLIPKWFVTRRVRWSTLRES